ncbi:hypothetical protein ACFFL1_09465 [Samsonia erythrinae]|uniref:Uncharacterized protein n=1 Tax=Samsonia erythrinae TaxID=160434 RepID=A0A4R3VKM8_9GAMM|nr:hypothetical protein [Samsonia erythrinae]TCV06813.1 hypothetical protein EDC54_10359 [Samsonia erythrinae]
MLTQKPTLSRPRWTLLPLLLCSALLSSLFTVHAAEKPHVMTASDQAEAQVIRAVRQGDQLKIDLRFETVADTFGGEIIYDDLSSERIENDVYLEAEGQRWPLSAAGKAAVAKTLRLNFSYDRKKNPRVGSWQGLFVAPPATVERVTLILPGLPPIPDIVIINRP